MWVVAQAKREPITPGTRLLPKPINSPYSPSTVGFLVIVYQNHVRGTNVDGWVEAAFKITRPRNQQTIKSLPALEVVYHVQYSTKSRLLRVSEKQIYITTHCLCIRSNASYKVEAIHRRVFTPLALLVLLLSLPLRSTSPPSSYIPCSSSLSSSPQSYFASSSRGQQRAGSTHLSFGGYIRWRLVPTTQSGYEGQFSTLFLIILSTTYISSI